LLVKYTACRSDDDGMLKLPPIGMGYLERNPSRLELVGKRFEYSALYGYDLAERLTEASGNLNALAQIGVRHVCDGFLRCGCRREDEGSKQRQQSELAA
jgi:hypothetical protein